MPPPFRADQIGSLLRPQSLVDVRASLTKSTAGDNVQNPYHKSEPTSSQLSAVRQEEEKAIKDVVTAQMRKNIVPLVTGEYERGVFYDKMFESLTNFEVKYMTLDNWREGFPTNRPILEWGLKGRDAGVAIGKVSMDHSAYLDDWLFFRDLIPKNRWKDAKITMPPPGWWHAQLKEPFLRTAYDSDEAFLQDMSAAFRKEILTLYDNDLRFVQIDDPNLSFFCDEEWIQVSKKNDTDLDRLLELYIKSHNDMLRELPKDLNIGLHICRGNFPGGRGVSSGGYERIAAKLFNETDYELFYLEFDSPRAGDFTPLRHLPAHKAVVLGVVTTKFAEMENLESLKGRVEQAADVIAKAQGRSRQEVLHDNLAVSPQCGFASNHAAGGVDMDMDRVWEKLELVKALAESLWPGWNS